MSKNPNSLGTPLSEAWFRFASGRLKKALWDAENNPSPSVPDINSAGKTEPVTFLFNYINAVLKQNAPENEAIFEMQRELQSKLQRGKLVAWGYRTKPDFQKTSDQIPAYVFLGKLNWSKSTVVNGDQKYEGVEVRNIHTPRQQLIHGVDPAINSQPEAKIRRPGPKSLGNIIVETYQILDAEGAFSNCETQKARWKRVVAHIQKTAKQKLMRGLSYPSFCRHINKHFNQHN